MENFDVIENAATGFAAAEEAWDFVKKIRHADVVDADEVRHDAYLAQIAIEKLTAALEAASEELSKAQIVLAGVAATARHASDHYAKAANYVYRQLDQNSPEFRQFEEALWDGSRTLDLLIPENH